MAECPVIKFGVDADGANEYSVQSGRELFRCGSGGTDCCIKMFITNVVIERNHVKYICGQVSDALLPDEGICIQSINASWKDKTIVNWIGVGNGNSQADTSWNNGSVITTRNEECGVPYTHTEGTISAKAQFNISGWNVTKADALRVKAKHKIVNGLPTLDAEGVAFIADTNTEIIFSDISTNISQTDWQGGGCTYQLFGFRGGRADDDPEMGYKMSFNYQNGQGESAISTSLYPRVTVANTQVSTLVEQIMESEGA